MNKTIQVEDIHLIAALTGINFKQKPSTVALVLAEIIRMSEDGIVLYPTILQKTICEKLNMNRNTYQAVITKLTELKLITRNNSMVLLDPVIKTPFEKIIIQQK